MTGDTFLDSLYSFILEKETVSNDSLIEFIEYIESNECDSCGIFDDLDDLNASNIYSDINNSSLIIDLIFEHNANIECMFLFQ